MYNKNLLLMLLITLVIISVALQPTSSFADASGTQIYQNTSALDEPERASFDYEKNKEEKSLTQGNETIKKAKINDSRILVKIKQGQTFHPDRFGVKPIQVSSLLKKNYFIAVRVPDEEDYHKKLKQIQQDASVETAEPDYVGELAYTPDDPGYTSQWYLSKIKMPQAWDVERGSKDVTVAVLDSGINREHPDLNGRILPGYDFVNKDKNPEDDHGHGTKVSGIIAANADSFGIIGMDFHARILPVKVADSSGNISSQNLVEGIYFAIEQGADIINMSFGSYQASEMEKKAIFAAEKAGIVLVAAAGNDNLGEPSYPASYPGVISVAATTIDDERAGFSNFGQHIDMAAPGKEIHTTDHRGGFITDNGTSFSTPIISGMAALLKAAHPTWKRSQIEWAMEAAADSVDGERWSTIYGYGRVNAFAALNMEISAWADDAPNEKTQAKKLSFGKTEHDRIDYPMDIDWFRMDIENSGNVNVSIPDSSEMQDLVVIVYDQNGKKQFIDKAGIGEGEEFTFQVEKGSYHFGIFDYYDHWSEASYQLLIKQSHFGDVVQYVDQINELVDREVIHGYPDGTFRPKENVTRLQAVQMILIDLGIDIDTYKAPNPGFKDVKPGSYGYEAVAAAVDIGFIKGKENNTFDPKGDLTRGQMAAILVKAYNLQGHGNQEFVDVPEGHWAYEVINKLAANGITRGYPDRTYRPMESISREHFAVFLYN